MLSFSAAPAGSFFGSNVSVRNRVSLLSAACCAMRLRTIVDPMFRTANRRFLSGV